jgi:hypothetical protein
MSSISPCDEQPRSSSVPEAKELTEYAGCVISRVSDARETNDNSGPLQERKSAPGREEQCESTAVSVSLDRSVPCSCGKKKRKGTTIKLKDEHLDLRCEWRNCNYHTCKLDLFVRHVSLHIPQLSVEVNEDLKGTGSVVFPRILPSVHSNAIYAVTFLFIHSFIPGATTLYEFWHAQQFISFYFYPVYTLSN